MNGQRHSLPGGGSVLTAAEYLSFVRSEYLGGYVSRGGAAVKVLVTADDAADELTAGLSEVAGGFVHVAVDAAETRVHMVDQLFVAVARSIDWAALAADVLRRAYSSVGFPADGELAVAKVAADHEVHADELYRSVRRALERMLLADETLAHEFRIAMLRLCQAELGRGDVDAVERDTVLGWLQGSKLTAARLRTVSLHARVARHNARPLLLSLARWVRRAGRPGMVLVIDLERLAVSRRPPVELRDGVYYSKAAVLDAYEVLRQLVDATDELEGVFVAVLLPPELVTDETRGLPAYSALQLRVADEVRDRRRPNPYASLMRLGVRLEAVR